MFLNLHAINLAKFWYLYAGAKLRGSSESRCSSGAERESKDVSVKCTKGYGGWICGADLLSTVYVLAHHAMTVDCHHIITFEGAHSKFHCHLSTISLCKIFAMTYQLGLRFASSFTFIG